MVAAMTRARTIVAAVLALLAAAGPVHADKIRIGTEGGYPPFNFVDAAGRLMGFDIDIAEALCARMKAECQFVTQDFEGLVPGLVAGKYDAVIASLWITDERKQKVDFTRKYYQAPARFAMRKGEGAGGDISPEALKGKRLSAQSSTVYANFLEDLYKGSTIKLFEEQEEANASLASGTVDAVLGDGPALWRWMAKDPQGQCCEFVGPPLKDPKWFGEGVAIAVAKGDTALKERFDKAIDSIVADGTYKVINDKYFPFSIY
jgi:lysine-arginine-ornithine-binding protein